MTADQRQCAGHETIKAILGDHEDRLREKRDRILKLEMEAKHMQEKLDLVVRQNSDIKTSLDALRTWQIYLMGGCGAVALVYSLVSGNWAGIVRLIGGGA